MSGLRDLPCAVVLLRLQGLGVCVPPVDAFSGPDGACVHLTRGPYYYPLVYTSDTATVYAQELEALLLKLKIDADVFMEGVDLPPPESG